MAEIGQAARYREIKRLGGGGMARVTLAEDTVLGRPVALKRVYSHGDPRGLLRLKREAMVGASLNHPNLVFVYDAQIQDDGDVVIVMEYVDGETLADAIRDRGALPPAEAMRVLRGVAAALDAIHEQGIVHRDVKPANVLLGRDGAVKLADLGVADAADRTRITSAGAVVGSFSYMSPEQLDGAAPSPAMDIYALGAVAYEMLSGQRARPESNPLALAHAISTQAPPNLRDAWPAAPRAAAQVLRRAMSVDPAKRPPSAGELVRQLESTLTPARPPREARVPPAPPPAGEARARRSILAPVLLALAALAVCAVAVIAITSGAGNGARTSAHTTTGDTRATGTTSRTATRTSSANAASRSTKRANAPATPTTSSQSAPPTTSALTPVAPPATPTTTTPATTPPVPSGSASGSPASAVEQFYEAAANHQYAAAWALADPNLRSQLGGYSSFQNTFSSVRSITFHSARAVPGGADAATVTLSTTSVQTDRTQQCSGTAQTVRSGGAWLLDHISISCS